MSTVYRTKKTILAATVTVALACTGLQSALAMPGAGGQPPCPMQGQQLDEATIKARDTFLSETTELRKAMVEKRAAKMALMNSTAPDPEKAAQLAGELFDLREQLRTKATTAGLPGHMMMGMGMGKMGCNGPRMGGQHHKGAPM